MSAVFSRIGQYLSMIRFSHTIFAMPFALLGFFTGVADSGGTLSVKILVLIVLCMIFARNSAMAFNRFADRNIDAQNPRTAGREIPAGIISPGAAIWFTVINVVLFIVAAAFINKLTFILSPVALAVILGYSFTKRFTSMSHLVLGLGLSLAPVGAYISVTGQFDIIPVLTGLIVLTWVGGFDIIYSLQDAGFDSRNSLHSIPARFGERGATMISILLHIISVVAAVATGLAAGSGFLYFTGTLIFAILLITEQIVARPGDQKRINMAFATINSYAGVVYVAFAIADLYF